MTLLEYVENPMGKGSMILPNTKMKQGFISTFSDVSNTMKITWYQVMNTYIAVISLPSQSSSKKDIKLNYDIVFQFKNVPIFNKVAIMNADWSVYSNSPSFIFTYAHVFYKQGMICKWLANKLDRTLKTMAPNVRNQYKVIGYERSLYLSALKVLQSISNPIPISGGFTNPIKSNYTHLSTTIKSVDVVLAASKSSSTTSEVVKGMKATTPQYKKASSSTKSSSIHKVATTKKTSTTPKTPKTRKI